MQKLETKHSFFASCPKGLEDVLFIELDNMKLHELEKHTGGVSFTDELTSFCQPILKSAIASRIFLQLAKGKFNTVKELEKFSTSIDWTQLLTLKQTFRFKLIWDRSLNDELKNSLFWAQKFKDALADQFRHKFKKRPDVGTKEPDVDFMVRIDKDKNISVLIDLCGDPLHKRGYRHGFHEAPLKENLAAGVIKLTNWDGSQPLIDPMSGSGTLLTEALLLKFKISPQILNIEAEEDNLWSFEEHYFFKKHPEVLESYKKLRTELIEDFKTAKKKIKEMKGPFFFANDLEDKYLQICEDQFREFSAEHLLKTYNSDILKLKKDDFLADEIKAIIITNPPYGERLNDLEKLEHFYYQMGEVLKNNFKNCSAYILSGNLEMRKKIRLRTNSKKILFNGPIECRLLEYDLF